ncbi:type VII secretion integral membrane protein EccD [Saccharomonospora marina XMU15]|uniref:Type VII secretion integral membrane protein EccD n=1 Tax=Saccharomonospora marina XMU15 TaxID=882083 RepID=H5X096_9PSEU|nr:type VII secretion integral membrane protein EccD [Saccharomonospora marina]EHR48556.1 type VII secretion integral membrane protein EccD [Saccharomonospora marina XMU15]
MTSAMGLKLAKVTISTPKRGIDVALPEDVTLAELLPYILRHAGDETADAGERHGGWALSRPTGERLDPRQTLGAQGVRDGEVLHLVAGQVEWPEIEYDDLVETIASGARRYGRSWGRAATRRCGLAVAVAVLGLATLVVFLFRPPWLVPGLVLLGAATVLLAAGVVVARTVPDALAGAAFAGPALVYAFLGGLVLTAPDHANLFSMGPPRLLLGSISLLVFGIVGYVGVAAVGRVFMAAITVGLLGTLGALFGNPLSPDGAAALVLTVGIALLPGYPMLAVRLGRVPLPELPQRSAELLEDDKPVPTPAVFAAAARADEVLSGLLLGLSVASVFASLYLLGHGGGAWLIMLVLVAVALLLRARIFPVPRQRIPLLVGGILVSALLAYWLATRANDNAGVGVFLLGIGLLAMLLAYAGLVYSRKNPSPQLGRIADILDVVAILALIPFAAYITGFFSYVQGLMASIG